MHAVEAALRNQAAVPMRFGPTTTRPANPARTAENLRMLFIPEQFANGFLITEDDTTLLYNVSRPYGPGNEHGIRWDDPTIGVEWPRAVEHVSDKDAAWPHL